MIRFEKHLPDAPRPARFVRARLAFGLLAWTLADVPMPRGAEAKPVAVKAPESTGYGTLALSSAGGKRLADGELIQKLVGENVESRLVFRFDDGSLYDEVVVFSQEKVFRLVSYSLVQKGPSFPEDMVASFDRAKGRYTVAWKDEPDGEEEVDEGDVELPDDVYNGMAGLLMRNAGTTATGHILAFTPAPRLLALSVVAEGKSAFTVGRDTQKATRYRLVLEIGGLTGLLAAAIGKVPPEVRYWVAEPAPAFLKFEGAMYLDGPIWTIEPAPARWKE